MSPAWGSVVRLIVLSAVRTGRARGVGALCEVPPQPPSPRRTYVESRPAVVALAIAASLRDVLTEHRVIHGDETPVKMLMPRKYQRLYTVSTAGDLRRTS